MSLDWSRDRRATDHALAVSAAPNYPAIHLRLERQFRVGSHDRSHVAVVPTILATILATIRAAVLPTVYLPDPPLPVYTIRLDHLPT